MHCDAFLSPNLTSFIHQQRTWIVNVSGGWNCNRNIALNCHNCSSALRLQYEIIIKNSHARRTAMDRAYFSLACATDYYFVHISLVIPLGAFFPACFFFSPIVNQDSWILLRRKWVRARERKSILVYLIIQRLPLSRSCKSFVIKTGRKKSAAMPINIRAMMLRCKHRIDT